MANWSPEASQWICPEHETSDCVNTFRNMSLLDELSQDPASAEHPLYPSEEDIVERRHDNESARVHHAITFMLQQKLTLDDWELVNDRLGEVLERMGIEYISNGGPIPESSLPTK